MLKDLGDLPASHRSALDVMIVEAGIAEQSGDLAEALRLYEKGHAVCVVDFKAPLSPQAVELRVRCAEMKLWISFRNGSLCMEDLATIDAQLRECEGHLERFPDAYDALRINILKLRLSILDNQRDTLDRATFEERQSSLEWKRGSLEFLVSVRNSG
jgi:hypothetical protein